MRVCMSSDEQVYMQMCNVTCYAAFYMELFLALDIYGVVVHSRFRQLLWI